MYEDQPPPILYKYISWNNEYHRKIINFNKVYFSSSYKFNDPFEGAIPLQFEKIDERKALSFIEKYIKRINPQLSDEKIAELAATQYDKELYKDPENSIFARKHAIDLNYETYGIFSMSSTCHNILMWSHYADSHRGLCIGFDTERLKQDFYVQFETSRLLIKPFKVKYESEYPLISPNNSAEQNFLSQFTTKHKNWGYEEEWRYILMDRINKEIEISADSISIIILGCRIPGEHRMEIIEFLREQSSHAKLYQNMVSMKKFGLEYYPILYRK